MQLRREEPGTREALERLVVSVSRHLDPGRARPAKGLEFAESRPLGGTHALDALRERLGIGPALRELPKGRRLDPSAERVLFALTADRALAPSSKLAAARWASEGVFIPGLPATSDDACYRAMDGCWRSARAWTSGSSTGPPRSSGSRSTCCSSIRPDRIAVGTFAGPAGTFRQGTEISPAQQGILDRLGIDPPPKIYQLTTAVTG